MGWREPERRREAARSTEKTEAVETKRVGVSLSSSNTGCEGPMAKSRSAETLTPRASANVKRP